MHKILFICHGNICRSPMAEYIMKALVAEIGVADEFCIESAAVSSEELGNAVYPPVRQLLSRRGIDCSGKTARKVAPADYDRFDLLVCMDNDNIRRLRRIVGGDSENKLGLLLGFTDDPRSVADPWFTRDFDAAMRDIENGCRGILRQLGYL